MSESGRFRARNTEEGVEFRVRVVPRASRTEVAGTYRSALRVRVTAPPVDGRANDALIEFLADALDVSKGSVEIVSGQAAREKKIRVWGLTAQELGPLVKRSR